MATIRKRDQVWQVQIRRLGHPSLSRSFKAKANADAWARQTEAAMERGEVQLIDQDALREPLGSILVRYRDKVTPSKKGASVEAYRIGTWLDHPISKIPLSKLTPVLLAGYRDERLKLVQPGTVRTEFGLIRHIIEVARNEWGMPLAVNPVSKIKLPGETGARHRRLEEGEFQALMTASRKGRNQLLEPIILVAIETGMRRGEIVGACWSNLDLDQRTLHLPVTKNGHPRTIPLSTTAVKIIRKVPRTEERVFPMTANAVRLAWERLRRRAGITDLHFHDLRHEAISRFFEKGLSVPEVTLISGHRDYRMLFRYTHLRAEDIVAKLE